MNKWEILYRYIYNSWEQTLPKDSQMDNWIQGYSVDWDKRSEHETYEKVLEYMIKLTLRESQSKVIIDE